MKRIVMIAAAVVGLVTAGIAVAHGVDAKGVKQVSATFTATTASKVNTTTCKASDGSTYEVSRGTYAGTSTSSEPTLNGPITADVTSIVNTTTGLGTADARLRIASGSNGHTDSKLSGVISGGSLVGLATGKGHNSGLTANVSATYSSTAGLTNGKIGGASGGDAVEFTGAGCSGKSSESNEKIEAHGIVSAVSLTSITVAGVTCAVPLNLQALVGSKAKVGTVANIGCSVSGGTNTLTKFEAKGASPDSKPNKKH